MLLICSLIATVVVRWHWWQSGVQVTVLAFGGLSPFMDLALMLFSLSIIIYAVVAVFGSRSTLIRRITLLILALIIPFSPNIYMPTQLDGFQSTMEKVPQSQWHEFASDAQRLIEKHRANGHYYEFSHWNRPVVDELTSKFEFLNYGHWPPALNDRGNRIQIWWGNGMVGTLEVEIWTEQPNSGAYNSPGTIAQKMHDRVYVISRS